MTPNPEITVLSEAKRATLPWRDRPVISRDVLEAGVAHLRAVEPKLAGTIDLHGLHGLPEKLLHRRGPSFPVLIKSVVNQQVSMAAARSIYQKLILACGLPDRGLGETAPEQGREGAVEARAGATESGEEAREAELGGRAGGGDAGEDGGAIADGGTAGGDGAATLEAEPLPETGAAVALELSGTGASGASSAAADVSGDVTAERILTLAPEELRACGLSGRKVEYVRAVAEAHLAGSIAEPALERMTAEEVRAAVVAVRGLGPWTADMFAIFHHGSADIMPVGDIAVLRGYGNLHDLSTRPSAQQVLAGTEHWSPYRSVGALYLWKLSALPNSKKQARAAKGKKAPKAAKGTKATKAAAGAAEGKEASEAAAGAEGDEAQSQEATAAVADLAREALGEGEMMTVKEAVEAIAVEGGGLAEAADAASARKRPRRSATRALPSDAAPLAAARRRKPAATGAVAAQRATLEGKGREAEVRAHGLATRPRRVANRKRDADP